MTALLLAPHNDDETLFAAYTCLRERPYVVTVLRSVVQEANGIKDATRALETRAALKILGCEGEQWLALDDDPSWSDVEEAFVILERRAEWESVFAPWPEPGGHPQHNHVGKLAREVFGDRVRFYTTYRYGGPRSTGVPVEPEPAWILAKLRALACYESQILNGPRRFFTHALDEWYAE